MKLFKLFAITATSVLCVVSSSFSQDNTVPTSGNVGLGTLNPSARLDVNGNMKVDSTLHVKDSILVEDNVRVMSDMRVEGETNLDGSTKIEGDLYLPNMTFDPNFTGKFVLIDDNAKLIGSGTANDFGNLIYSKQCQLDPNGNYPNPQ